MLNTRQRVNGVLLAEGYGNDVRRVNCIDLILVLLNVGHNCVIRFWFSCI